jgi:ketosteroid isomerase-like protein
MSQENVELVRVWFEAWNRNDWDAMGAAVHPDVIGIGPEEWPEGQVPTSGPEELRQQFERLKESWEEERAEIDEIRNVDGGALVLFRWIAKGRGSGVDVEMPMATVIQFREGKAFHVQFFIDRSKALEAAGLSE